MMPTFFTHPLAHGLAMCQLAGMEKQHPLALWRESKGKSQDDAAVLFGVTRWTINRIEVGERKPSPGLVKRIEAKTGIARHQLRPDIYEAAQ